MPVEGSEPMASPAPAAASDAALIAAWQAGDEGAATELVRRHTRALARYLAAAGAPEADLDDVVQDTFVRAFRGLERFRGQRPEGPGAPGHAAPAGAARRGRGHDRRGPARRGRRAGVGVPARGGAR